VYIVTNMHASPVEGNFSDESGRAIKPTVVEDYNTTWGLCDKSDRMVEVDKETVFPPHRHDLTESVSYP
jgi:hypothetical protein